MKYLKNWKSKNKRLLIWLGEIWNYSRKTPNLVLLQKTLSGEVAKDCLTSIEQKRRLMSQGLLTKIDQLKNQKQEVEQQIKELEEQLK